MFIGFDENSPAKLIYNPHTGEIKKAQDVKFLDALYYPNQGVQNNQTPNKDNVIPPNIISEPPIVNENELTSHSDTAIPPYNLRRKASINYNETDTYDIKNVNPMYMPVNPVYVTNTDTLYDNMNNIIPNGNQIFPHQVNPASISNSDTEYYDINNTIPLNDIHYQTCFNVNHSVIRIPNSYKQAMLSNEREFWKDAADEEFQSLLKAKTWRLVEWPLYYQVIGGRWVFSIKTDPSGNLRYKARYVAQGYTQMPGINYNDTYAPTARMTSIRILANISVQLGMHIEHLDVNNAYLNAPVDFEDMYLTQPEGYVTNPNLVCKLNKSIYGLKQSANRWHTTLTEFMHSQGLRQSEMDKCLFVRHTRHSTMLIIIWVDDLIVSASNAKILHDFKTNFCNKFKCKDLGSLAWFLGIEFKLSKYVISMNQSLYINNILQRFNETNSAPRNLPCDPSVYDLLEEKSEPFCNPTRYRELIGSLIYLMTGTRPDICFIVTLLSRFMNNPTKMQMTIARGVLKYLKGTLHFDLKFVKSEEPLRLMGYSDSDFASGNDYHSVSGYGYKLSNPSAFISWRSEKQSLIASSSCEAEYIAMHGAVCEALFLRQLFSDFTNSPPQTVLILADNQGAITLSKHSTYHKRTKHISLKFHATRKYVENKSVAIFYVPSKDNLADMATKPIKGPYMKRFSSIRGIIPKHLKEK